jgi:hypothetical protein
MANMSSESEQANRQRGSEQAPGLADKLARGASSATGQAVEHIQNTRERLDGELSRRRSRLTERIREVRDVLDSAGRKLGDEDMLADGLQFVSGSVERLASYVESADPSRLAADVRELARERPGWFFGGTFVVGLALGRFAHSTRETREEPGGSGTGSRRPGGPSRARATTSRDIGDEAEASPQRAGGAGRAVPGVRATAVRPATGPRQGTDEP